VVGWELPSQLNPAYHHRPGSGVRPGPGVASHQHPGPPDDADRAVSHTSPAVSSPPSGRQIELVHGELRAVVVEVGGGLRVYEVGGRPVVDGYGVDDVRTGGRGQPLVPWPNRVDRGRYSFGAADLQLPLTEPDRANAIHGLTGWARWDVRDRRRDRVTMGYLLPPQTGYPFTLDLAITYALGDDGLTVGLTAGNAGPVPLPFGAGFHPYLTVGTELVDGATLTVGAEAVLESDERGIPTGKVLSVEEAGLDFRGGREIGTTVLDHCFTGLARDGDGRASARLTAPGGTEVGLWADDRFTHLMVFTGDTLEPARRRRGLAVEPMTCPPNAFRTGTDVVVLEPGDAASAAWGITPLSF